MSTIPFNTTEVRAQFPILSTKVRGRPLIYLDNAATLQKPRSVIEATQRFYGEQNANVHRGVHWLSQVASEAYESVRGKVSAFVKGSKENELIFTSGTTAAANLVASSISDWVQEGDSIVVTRMEHHSNFVPWQQLAKRRGANFKIVDLTSDLRIDLESLKTALSSKPKVLSFTLMSNVTGVITPARQIAEMAKAAGAWVFADAAQAAAHLPLNLADLGPIDFLAFSGHKLGGPTGTGVLWGRETILKKLPPYQFGGDMIRIVEDQDTQWNELPWKFEAGTPNIAGVIGLGVAIDYLMSVGMESIAAHERELAQAALARLQRIPGLKLFGPSTAENRGAVLSFTLEGVHPHDLATFLDVEGIAVRAGHHCAQPLMRSLGLPATTRASFAFYNTLGEIDVLAAQLEKAPAYFGQRRSNVTA